MTEVAEQIPAQNDQQTLSELKTLIQSLSGGEVYDARLAITVILKATVSEFKVAAAGSTPIASRSDALIRRDGPGRYFEIRFAGGPTLTGFPAGPMNPTAGMRHRRPATRREALCSFSSNRRRKR